MKTLNFSFCILNRMIPIQTGTQCRAQSKELHCLSFVLFIWLWTGFIAGREKKSCVWELSCEKAYTLWYANTGWCGSWIQDSLVFMATSCPSSFTSLSSIATAGELSGASLIQVCVDKKKLYAILLRTDIIKNTPTSTFLLWGWLFSFFKSSLHPSEDVSIGSACCSSPLPPASMLRFAPSCSTGDTHEPTKTNYCVHYQHNGNNVYLHEHQKCLISFDGATFQSSVQDKIINVIQIQLLAQQPNQTRSIFFFTNNNAQSEREKERAEKQRRVLNITEALWVNRGPVGSMTSIDSRHSYMEISL